MLRIKKESDIKFSECLSYLPNVVDILNLNELITFGDVCTLWRTVTKRQYGRMKNTYVKQIGNESRLCFPKPNGHAMAKWKEHLKFMCSVMRYFGSMVTQLLDQHNDTGDSMVEKASVRFQDAYRKLIFALMAEYCGGFLKVLQLQHFDVSAANLEAMRQLIYLEELRLNVLEMSKELWKQLRWLCPNLKRLVLFESALAGDREYERTVHVCQNFGIRAVEFSGITMLQHDDIVGLVEFNRVTDLRVYDCERIDLRLLGMIGDDYLKRIRTFHFATWKASKPEYENRFVDQIGLMERLRDLSLCLPDEELDLILSALEKCRHEKIKSLILTNLNLDRADVARFMETVQKMKNITWFQVRGSGLTAQNLLDICRGRENLEVFYYLTSRKLVVGRVQKKEFIKAFSAMRHLRILLLSTQRVWTFPETKKVCLSRPELLWIDCPISPFQEDEFANLTNVFAHMKI